MLERNLNNKARSFVDKRVYKNSDFYRPSKIKELHPSFARVYQDLFEELSSPTKLELIGLYPGHNTFQIMQQLYFNKEIEVVNAEFSDGTTKELQRVALSSSARNELEEQYLKYTEELGDIVQAFESLFDLVRNSTPEERGDLESILESIGKSPTDKLIPTLDSVIQNITLNNSLRGGKKSLSHRANVVSNLRRISTRLKKLNNSPKARRLAAAALTTVTVSTQVPQYAFAQSTDPSILDFDRTTTEQVIPGKDAPSTMPGADALKGTTAATSEDIIEAVSPDGDTVEKTKEAEKPTPEVKPETAKTGISEAVSEINPLAYKNVFSADNLDSLIKQAEGKQSITVRYEINGKVANMRFNKGQLTKLKAVSEAKRSTVVKTLTQRAQEVSTIVSQQLKANKDRATILEAVADKTKELKKNQEGSEKSITQPLRILNKEGNKITLGVESDSTITERVIENKAVSRSSNISLIINGEKYQGGYIIERDGLEANVKLAFSSDNGKTWKQFDGIQGRIGLQNGEKLTFVELQNTGVKLSTLDAIKTIANKSVLDDKVKIGQIVLANKVVETPESRPLSTIVDLVATRPEVYKDILLYAAANTPKALVQNAITGNTKISLKDLQTILLSVKQSDLDNSDFSLMNSDKRQIAAVLLEASKYLNADGSVTSQSLYGISENRVIGSIETSNFSNVPLSKIAVNAVTTFNGADDIVSMNEKNGQTGMPLYLEKFLTDKNIIKDENLRTQFINAFSKAYSQYKTNPNGGLTIDLKIKTPGGLELDLSSSYTQLEMLNSIQDARDVSTRLGLKASEYSQETIARLLITRKAKELLDVVSPMSIGKDGINASQKYSRVERRNLKLQIKGNQELRSIKNELLQKAGITPETIKLSQYSNVDARLNQRQLPQGIVSVLATLASINKAAIGLDVESGTQSSFIVTAKFEDGTTQKLEIPKEDMIVTDSSFSKRGGTPWTGIEMSQVLSKLLPGVPVPGIGIETKATDSTKVVVSSLDERSVDELVGDNATDFEKAQAQITSDTVVSWLNDESITDGYVVNRNQSEAEFVQKRVIQRAQKLLTDLQKLAIQKESRGEVLTQKEQQALEKCKIILSVSESKPEVLTAIVKRNTSSRFFAEMSKESENIPVANNKSFKNLKDSLNTSGLGGMMAEFGKDNAQKDVLRAFFKEREYYFNRQETMPQLRVDYFLNRLKSAGLNVTYADSETVNRLKDGKTPLLTTTHNSNKRGDLEITNIPLKGFDGKIVTIEIDGVKIHALNDKKALACPQPHVEMTGKSKQIVDAEKWCNDSKVCYVNVPAFNASMKIKVDKNSIIRSAVQSNAAQSVSTRRESALPQIKIKQASQQMTDLSQQIAAKYAESKLQALTDKNASDVDKQIGTNLSQNGAAMIIDTAEISQLIREGKIKGASIGLNGAGIQFGDKITFEQFVKMNSTILSFTYRDTEDGPIPCLEVRNNISRADKKIEENKVTIGVSFTPLPKKEEPKKEEPKPEPEPEEEVTPDSKTIDNSAPTDTQTANPGNAPKAPDAAATDKGVTTTAPTDQAPTVTGTGPQAPGTSANPNNPASPVAPTEQAPGVGSSVGNQPSAPSNTSGSSGLGSQAPTNQAPGAGSNLGSPATSQPATIPNTGNTGTTFNPSQPNVNQALNGGNTVAPVTAPSTPNLQPAAVPTQVTPPAAPQVVTPPPASVPAQVNVTPTPAVEIPAAPVTAPVQVPAAPQITNVAAPSNIPNVQSIGNGASSVAESAASASQTATQVIPTETINLGGQNLGNFTPPTGN